MGARLTFLASLLLAAKTHSFVLDSSILSCSQRYATSIAEPIEQQDATCLDSSRVVLNEICEQKGITLRRFMVEASSLNPEMKELSSFFVALEIACKAISVLVRRNQLPTEEMLGFGDEQQREVEKVGESR